MKRGRSLRDIFNLKRVRCATAAFVAALTMAGGCVAENHGPGQKTTPPNAVVVSGCSANTNANAPKLPYDEELFRENDDQAPSAAVLKMTPAQRMSYYMNKFCFTADQTANDNNPRDKGLIAALNTLSGVTYMGKPLIDLADQSHLKFCALKHMPAGTAAEYLSTDVFIASGQNAQSQGQVLDIAHEILHAAQGQHGLMSYDYNWDIESRVRRNLTIEAAPVALEFSVAYEKKLAGDPSYWEYLKKHNAHTAYTNPDNHRLFEETYNAAIAMGGTEDAALHAAAHALFERVFQSDDWRRFYLTSELNSYVADIAANKFAGLGFFEHNAFGQDKVDLAGKVGDLPSFTKDGHVPDYADFFKADPKMQWAYEAADLARYKQQLGPGNDTVKDLEVQAVLHKNPYIGLDFADLCHRIETARWRGTFAPTWQLMDDMLKDKGAHAAPANNNCATPDAKVSTPRAPGV